MNAANNHAIQPNWKSRRFETTMASANGIEKYEAAMTASETTCSQISSGSHSRQMPWGENIDESNRRSRAAHMSYSPS